MVKALLLWPGCDPELKRSWFATKQVLLRKTYSFSPDPAQTIPQLNPHTGSWSKCLTLAHKTGESEHLAICKFPFDTHKTSFLLAILWILGDLCLWMMSVPSAHLPLAF